MDALLQFLLNWWKNFDGGSLPNFPNSDPPADLGSALTQDEIDWVKSLKKEMDERFTAL